MMRRRLLSRLAISLVAVVALASCGDEPTTPASDVPGLATALGRIDDALAEHRYAAARRQLDALVEKVSQALAEGDLTAVEADRVTAAAARLLLALPAPPTATPTPTPTPEPERDGDGDRGDDDGDGDGDGGNSGDGGDGGDHGKGKDNGKGHGHD